MSYLRWLLLTTSLILVFTTASVWLETRLRGDAGMTRAESIDTAPRPAQVFARTA